LLQRDRDRPRITEWKARRVAGPWGSLRETYTDLRRRLDDIRVETRQARDRALIQILRDDMDDEMVGKDLDVLGRPPAVAP
jgi:hypothetical protein